MRKADFLLKILPRSVLRALLRVYRFVSGSMYSSRTKLMELNGGLYLAFKDNFTDEKILKEGKYEENLQRIMKSMIRDDWTVIDIGANTGVHTLLMAREAINGKIYAFEPVDYNYKRLNTNVFLSGLGNISIHGYAIGDKKGELALKTIKPARREQGSASLVMNEYLTDLGNEAFYEKKVKVTSLDEFIAENEVRSVDFVKMDIEGYEYWALLGMVKTIATHRPILIIEYNLNRITHLGLSNSEMENILGDYYDCYEIAKFDYIQEYSLDPFLFDRYIQADLLCVPKPAITNT